MKAKRKGPLFVCSFSENAINILKCTPLPGERVLKVEAETLEGTADQDRRAASALVRAALSRLGFRNHPFVVSLAQRQAASRFLKIPATAPDEIERIISLQALGFLPFPAEELAVGYQVVAQDPGGYAHLVVAVASAENIAGYLEVLGGAGAKGAQVVVSSYGIACLFSFLRPSDTETTMVVSISSSEAEVAIVRNQRLIFSRSFAFSRLAPDWQDGFVDEIRKTQKLYLAETESSPLAKVVLLGSDRLLLEYADTITKGLGIPAETLAFEDRFSFAKDLESVSPASIAALLGLALAEIPATFVLLSSSRKEQLRLSRARANKIQTALLIIGILLVWLLSVYKALENKRSRLELLNREVAMLKEEAQPLEYLKKHLRLLELRTQRRPVVLEALFELYRIMPAHAHLTSFNFQDKGELVLRGQAKALSFVLMLVSELEKSSVFQDAQIKLKYATQRRISSGEAVDFEIACFGLAQD